MTTTATQGCHVETLPDRSSYQTAFDQAVSRSTEHGPAVVAYWTGTGPHELRAAVCEDHVVQFLDIGVLDVFESRYKSACVWPEHNCQTEPSDFVHALRMGCLNLSDIVGPKAFAVLSVNAVKGIIDQAFAAVVRQAADGRRRW